MVDRTARYVAKDGQPFEQVSTSRARRESESILTPLGWEGELHGRDAGAFLLPWYFT